MPARDAEGKFFAGLVCAVAMALAWGGAPRPALAADQTLELEVTINGVSTQKIGEFVLRDAVLLARPEEVGELGLRVPKAAALTPDGLVVVSTLPGVRASLDEAGQVLAVTTGDAERLPNLLRPAPRVNPTPLQSSLGATLNYDVANTFTDGRAAAAGFFDARVFSPLGVASTDLIAHAGQPLQGVAATPVVRLDSTYVYSDFRHDRRYRLGDVISGGLAWTRPVRLGGVQITHDFSMRPDLVTFPLPSVAGTTAVPSTVDVLLNGAKLLSGPVPAGPFQAPQLPVVTGAGQVTMTVTDALGRQVTTTLPFYASSSLLSPGLSTASVEAGFVRRNWGVVSNDYGTFAGSATWRGGLPSLTLEAHAEGTHGQLMAGAGLVANAFGLGVVNLAAAASRASGHTGVSVSAGAERLTHRLSFGIQAVLTERDFRDLAAINGDTTVIRQISANIGLALGRWGSAGLAYAEIERPAGRGAGVPLASARKAHVLSGNYSVQLGRTYLFAAVFKDFVHGGQHGASLGLSMPFGPRSSATATANAGGPPYAQLQAQQSVVKIGDWGYQAFLGAGGTEHVFGQAQFKSRWALFTAGADYLPGKATGRLEAQGAVSFIDRQMFASNTINDSFAVVDTSGLKGVKVYYEHREIGRTNAGGRLLAPDLRAFDVNHLSIDPSDLPADVAIATTARDVRPPDRSGVVVIFPIRVIHAALLLLVDEQGRPIPVGSWAMLKSGGQAAPVGYDGQVFFDELGLQNQVEVELPKGDRCVAAFAFTPIKGDIPRVGPVTCRKLAA